MEVSGLLRILLQRTEETFPAVAERMNCTKSEKVLVGPHGEAYAASHDADQAMNIKAEEASDAQEEAYSVQITIQEIKAEPENCTNLEKALVGPYDEINPAPHDASQAMNVKTEAVSDAEEEEDPVPITFPEIKAEPEHARLQLSLDGAILHGLDVDSVNSSSKTSLYLCITSSESMLHQK
ncbi:uncharacterized protein LOC111869194 isoform X3 [Cryptotermes secundus]|uniref:uncharacterized protein LOC111869194 isoform X3 n=1 Tax=Cryptotermes secundus TaxID=105785 RepID=UPI001454E160|nr:uncharacterized protein LOC111869194 isoform X3 [Cryptotermes secundus]